MKGKDKCKALKEIRHQIALNNDIEYVVSECKHQGECKGTCPKCEAEVLYLERELEKRRSLGKKVAVVGLSVGMAAAAAGCTNPVQTYVLDPIVDFLGGNSGGQDLAGAAVVDPAYVQGEVDYVEMGEPTEVVPDDIEDGSETVEQLDGDVAYVGDPECEDGNCEDGNCDDGDCEDGNCENGNCEDGNCEDGSEENSEVIVKNNPKAEIAGDIQYIP